MDQKGLRRKKEESRSEWRKCWSRAFYGARGEHG